MILVGKDKGGLFDKSLNLYGDKYTNRKMAAPNGEITVSKTG